MKKVVLSLGIGVMGASSLGIAPSAFAAGEYCYDAGGQNYCFKDKASMKQSLIKSISGHETSLKKLTAELDKVTADIKKAGDKKAGLERQLADGRRTGMPSTEQKKLQDEIEVLKHLMNQDMSQQVDWKEKVLDMKDLIKQEKSALAKLK